MSGAEFGNRMGKPPDRGKQPGGRSSEEYLARPAAEAAGISSRTHQDEQLQPPPAFAQSAAAEGLTSSSDGGGGQKPPRLRSVDSPEPPAEGPPPTTKEDAEVERQRVETDTIRANNEAIRAGTGIEEQEAASEIALNEERANSDIQLAENRAEIEDEAIEVDTEITRKERIFFMWMVAFGLLITTVSSIIAGLTGQPLFFTGSGIGLLATGGGLRRLSVLTSPRRRKECLLRKKSQERPGGENGKEAG